MRTSPRAVLQDDRGGHVGPLDRQVVEIIGSGHTQYSQQESLHDVRCGQKQLTATALPGQDGEQDQQ